MRYIIIVFTGINSAAMFNGVAFGGGCGGGGNFGGGGFSGREFSGNSFTREPSFMPKMPDILRSTEQVNNFRAAQQGRAFMRDLKNAQDERMRFFADAAKKEDEEKVACAASFAAGMAGVGSEKFAEAPENVQGFYAGGSLFRELVKGLWSLWSSNDQAKEDNAKAKADHAKAQKEAADGKADLAKAQSQSKDKVAAELKKTLDAIDSAWLLGIEAERIKRIGIEKEFQTLFDANQELEKWCRNETIKIEQAKERARVEKANQSERAKLEQEKLDAENEKLRKELEEKKIKAEQEKVQRVAAFQKTQVHANIDQHKEKLKKLEIDLHCMQQGMSALAFNSQDAIYLEQKINLLIARKNKYTAIIQKQSELLVLLENGQMLTTDEISIHSGEASLLSSRPSTPGAERVDLQELADCLEHVAQDADA